MSQDKAIAAALEALNLVTKDYAYSVNNSYEHALSGATYRKVEHAINLLSNIAREPVEQAHAMPIAWANDKGGVISKYSRETSCKELKDAHPIPLYASPPPAPSMPEVPKLTKDQANHFWETRVGTEPPAHIDEFANELLALYCDTPAKELEQGRDVSIMTNALLESGNHNWLCDHAPLDYLHEFAIDLIEKSKGNK